MAKDAAYREAEKRIEEAHRTGDVQLNLASIGLTEVPESIGELAKVKFLNLGGNSLAELPDSVGRLQCL